MVRFEPAKGLAQGSDGDTQRCRELYVVDPAARLQQAEEDLIPHLDVSAVGLGRRALGSIAIRHGVSGCSSVGRACPQSITLYYKILAATTDDGTRAAWSSSPGASARTPASASTNAPRPAGSRCSVLTRDRCRKPGGRDRRAGVNARSRSGGWARGEATRPFGLTPCIFRTGPWRLITAQLNRTHSWSAG